MLQCTFQFPSIFYLTLNRRKSTKVTDSPGNQHPMYTVPLVLCGNHVTSLYHFQATYYDLNWAYIQWLESNQILPVKTGLCQKSCPVTLKIVLMLIIFKIKTHKVCNGCNHLQKSLKLVIADKRYLIYNLLLVNGRNHCYILHHLRYIVQEYKSFNWDKIV